PIRRRGGVPFKLIEAMAAQRPVVATGALVRGLELPSGQALLIADSPRELADAIQLVLSDNELATRLASAARRTFEQDLCTEAVLGRLTASSLLARSAHAPEYARLGTSERHPRHHAIEPVTHRRGLPA